MRTVFLGLCYPFVLAILGWSLGAYTFATLLTFLGIILIGNGLWLLGTGHVASGWAVTLCGTLAALLDPQVRHWISRF